VTREDAYRLVQRHARRVREEGGNCKEKVTSDADMQKALAANDIEKVFDSERLISKGDRIFERVFV